MQMSKVFKTIPVASEAEAIEKISALSEQYHLKRLLDDDPLRVYNEHYTVYYDPDEQLVKMETAHSHVTEEQIKEFLIQFPPFV